MLNKLLTQTVIGTWYNINGRKDILEALKQGNLNSDIKMFEISNDGTKFKRISVAVVKEAVFKENIKIPKFKIGEHVCFKCTNIEDLKRQVPHVVVKVTKINFGRSGIGLKIMDKLKLYGVRGSYQEDDFIHYCPVIFL